MKCFFQRFDNLFVGMPYFYSVAWDCRIHKQHLCRGLAPPPRLLRFWSPILQKSAWLVNKKSQHCNKKCVYFSREGGLYLYISSISIKYKKNCIQLNGFKYSYLMIVCTIILFHVQYCPTQKEQFIDFFYM